jgi:hypothetical protein
VGGVADLSGSYGGAGAGGTAFVYGGLAALLVLGFVVSADTMMGANGLFCVLLGTYSLATGHWIIAEWLSIAGAGCSAMFGAFLIRLWLR